MVIGVSFAYRNKRSTGNVIEDTSDQGRFSRNRSNVAKTILAKTGGLVAVILGILFIIGSIFIILLGVLILIYGFLLSLTIILAILGIPAIIFGAFLCLIGGNGIMIGIYTIWGGSKGLRYNATD